MLGSHLKTPESYQNQAETAEDFIPEGRELHVMKSYFFKEFPQEETSHCACTEWQNANRKPINAAYGVRTQTVASSSEP